MPTRHWPGRSYDSAGRTADAEAAFKKAIALRPDSWDGYNSFGAFLDEHERYDEAVAQFRHAIELTPDNASLYLNLGAVTATWVRSTIAEAEQMLRNRLPLSPAMPLMPILDLSIFSNKSMPKLPPRRRKPLQTERQGLHGVGQP